MFERNRAESFLRIQRDLATALNDAEGLDEALKLCLLSAITASRLDCGGVYLVDADGGLSLAPYEGLSISFVTACSKLNPESTLARTVMRGHATYATLQEIEGELSPESAAERLTALAVVPIVHKGHVIACLNVASHTAAEIAPEAREHLETIAPLCGSAIARLKAEQELRESEAKYRALMHNAGDAILIFDANGAIIETNARVEALTGFSSAELLRTSFVQCHVESERQKAEGFFRRAVDSRKASFYDTMLVMKQGGAVPVDISLSHIEYHNRLVLQAVARDMSELRKVELLKEQIIRNLAHKLKTPIATAQMACDLLADTHGTPGEALFGRSMTLLRGSILHIREDVEHVLEYFRAGVKRLRTAAVSTPLKPTIEAIIAEEREIVNDGRIAFEYVEGPGAEVVGIDEMDLYTVMQNLLDNAVKFTKQGKVTVTSESMGAQVLVRVQDTGSGIPADVQQRIFEGFYQMNPAYPGLGLGLAMCKEIVERCGGTITAESAGKDQGAVVMLSLPTSSPPV